MRNWNRVGKLPPLDSVDGQRIIERVKAGEANKLWQELGYANKHSFDGAIRGGYGIKLSELPIAYKIGDISKPPTLNIPVLTLKEYIPQKAGGGDPETQVLVIGDDHACEVTATYNTEVYKKRMDVLFMSTMTITKLHRNMYSLNDLVVIDVGDNVHGENPYQGATIGSVEKGAVEQIYDIALPNLINLLCSFKQEFRKVTFCGVRGNHGRYSLTAPRISNWDMALYKALSQAKLPKGIEVNYSDDFCQLIDIEGFRFFIFHGDQVRAQMGIPYFALTRKVQSWYITYGGFAYAICGHFHKEDYLRVSAKCKLLINGSLVTDDPYALEVVGTSSIPTHWTFGVHNRMGLTWLYSLVVDKLFLPEKAGGKQ